MSLSPHADEAIRKFGDRPDIRRLKYRALAFIFLAIALILGAFFLGKLISWTFTIILWAVGGLCALICVILFTIFLYKSHHAYWNERNNNPLE